MGSALKSMVFVGLLNVLWSNSFLLAAHRVWQPGVPLNQQPTYKAILDTDDTFIGESTSKQLAKHVRGLLKSYFLAHDNSNPNHLQPSFAFDLKHPFAFAIATSDEVPEKNQILPMNLFGLSVLMWRTESGQLKLIENRCPHAMNWFFDASDTKKKTLPEGQLTCKFHEAKFDSAGVCSSYPSDPGLAGKMCFGGIDLIETDGLVFVVFGDLDKDRDLFPFTELRQYQTVTNQIFREDFDYLAFLKASLDFAHVPWVHKVIGKLYPRGRLQIQEKRVGKNYFRASLVSDSKVMQETFLAFAATNMVHLNLNKFLSIVVASVPFVDSNGNLKAKVIMRTYYKDIAAKLPKFLAHLTSVLANNFILEEDRFNLRGVTVNQDDQALRNTPFIYAKSDRANFKAQLIWDRLVRQLKD